MSENSSNIIQKIWSYSHVLRDADSETAPTWHYHSSVKPRP